MGYEEPPRYFTAMVQVVTRRLGQGKKTGDPPQYSYTNGTHKSALDETDDNHRHI